MKYCYNAHNPDHNHLHLLRIFVIRITINSIQIVIKILELSNNGEALSIVSNAQYFLIATCPFAKSRLPLIELL